MTPFDVDVEQVEMSLQMELLELQADDDLKSQFREVPLQDFYVRHVSKDKYPNLINFICKMMSLFGSTYCCEQFFSKMNFMKSKNRSSIINTNLESSLRVATTSLSPNIELLAKERQSQVSH